MKRPFLLILTAVMVTAGTFVGIYGAAGGKPTPTATRDLSDAEVRRTMDVVFRARVRDQLVWTDSLASECKGEPMYHLMRARLLRELIPVDDESKEQLKREAEPPYNELKTVIALCDARLDGGHTDDKLKLYRGWASSLMGAFLYFADTLPSAYKFVSKLLFLPSGDRDRGLQMMELARGFNSVMETDNALILYSVYLGFEGRYEEGLEGFERLRRDFPLHATFVRPEAIMYPLLPGRSAAEGDSLDVMTARVLTLPKDQIDASTATLVRFERAYADRFYHPARAMERLQQILNDDPPHPDWVPGFAAFELGRLQAA